MHHGIVVLTLLVHPVNTPLCLSLLSGEHRLGFEFAREKRLVEVLDRSAKKMGFRRSDVLLDDLLSLSEYFLLGALWRNRQQCRKLLSIRRRQPPPQFGRDDLRRDVCGVAQQRLRRLCGHVCGLRAARRRTWRVRRAPSADLIRPAR